MYLQFHALTAPPFEAAADTRWYFPTAGRRETLAGLEYLVRMRRGWGLVEGPAGVGKTTLGLMLAKRVADAAQVIHIAHTHRHSEDLLRQIVMQLGVSGTAGDNICALVERLQAHLLELGQRQRQLVILVDEAHTLTDATLEDLRLLGNLASPGGCLLQIMLLGLPPLRARLTQPALESLRQRLTMARQLHPFTSAETATYVQRRLRAASMDPLAPQVQFTDAALVEVHHGSGGIARLINLLADNALLLAYLEESHVVTPALVVRASDELMPDFHDVHVPSVRNAQTTISMERVPMRAARTMS